MQYHETGWIWKMYIRRSGPGKAHTRMLGDGTCIWTPRIYSRLCGIKRQSAPGLVSSEKCFIGGVCITTDRTFVSVQRSSI